MLETVIQDQIRQQRPYYLLQGNPIKGVNNQYWLVFQHRDAENLLHNIVSFLGIFENHYTHKLIRIDLKIAYYQNVKPNYQKQYILFCLY